MGIHHARPDSYRRSSPQTMQMSTAPAPTGGMDSRQNIAEGDPSLCIYSYNMIPAEYGMRVRKGYQLWTDGLGGTGVHTLIPYTGETSGGSADRLFAVTNEGIYDVSDQGVAPVLMYTFAIQVEGAGYGVYTHYTTEAETDLLFYADESNGLFEFDPALDTWVQTAGLIGLDPALITFVVSHKQRIWFCARNSTIGYYLPVGARTGDVTPFYFGSKFKHGGELVGLYSWSVDGGAGVDDYLVAVSRGGDVLPYQGEDPEVTWSNVGVYFIGELPRGTKIGTEYGGDLSLISEFGVTAMSDLLRSSAPVSPHTQSVTYKIASLIRQDVIDLQDQRGWELRHIPSEGLMVINMPVRATGAQVQYVLSRTTQGWCYFRDVPMESIDAWKGAAMVGTADGRILRMDVRQDNLIAAEPEAARDIEFSILFDYFGFGGDGLFKRGELLRPTFVAERAPTFNASMLYDFQISEILGPTTFTKGQPDGWDSGAWDKAVWAAGAYDSKSAIYGSFGIGRTMAIALRGYAISETVLANVDVMWRQGGAL